MDTENPTPPPPPQSYSKAQECFYLVVNLYVSDYTLQVQINSMYYPMPFDLVNNEQVYFKAPRSARNTNYAQLCSFFPLFLSLSLFFFNLFQAIQTPSSPNKSPPDTAIMQLIMAPAVRELHGKGLYNDEDIYGRPYCSFGKY